MMSDLPLKLRELASITTNKWNKKGATLENSYLNQAANLIEHQQQRIEELEQALTDDSVAKIMLEKMTLENGQLDIQMSGNIFHIFCEAFVKTFKETGAENYLTTEFHSSELGAFTVTMQRSQGMTVYEKLRKVEQERDELAATLERLEQTLNEHGKTIELSDSFQFQIDDDILDKALSEVPLQNLNAVKRELILELVDAYTHKLDNNDEEINQVSVNIIKKGRGFIYPEALIEYANTKYPSVKDGE